jgi:DNA-binding NarL/FixJ family response regulator
MSTRILVADDSVLMRRQIRKVLESDVSIEICAEAADGVDAVRKAQECWPDLAIIKLKMPAMNDLEVTRKIKALMPSVPVVIFALDNSPELERESEHSGADGILSKAEGGPRLSQVIHALLRRRYRAR